MRSRGRGRGAMRVGVAAFIGWLVIGGGGSAGAKPVTGRVRREAAARAAVIGGRIAEPGTFPFMADVFIRGEGENLYDCTGTVVAPRLVLTAGHCLFDPRTGVRFAPSAYTVTTDAINWLEGEGRERRAVRATVVFPGYRQSGPLAGFGDAGLLVLSRPVRAEPIQLAKLGEPELWAPRTRGLIAGWGITSPDQEGFTRSLRWAETVIQSPWWCDHYASDFHPVGQLCSIDPPHFETGGCWGDSGGPLVVYRGAEAEENEEEGEEGEQEPVEVGIIVSGQENCATTSPTVYTKAALIAPWVRSWIRRVG